MKRRINERSRPSSISDGLIFTDIDGNPLDEERFVHNLAKLAQATVGIRWDSLVKNGSAIRRKIASSPGQAKDVLVRFVPDDIISVVAALYGPDRVPRLVEGWSEEQISLTEEARALPTVFDEKTLRHVSRPDNKVLHPRGWLTHYCVGLIIQSTLWSKFPHRAYQFSTASPSALGYGLENHHAVSEFGLSLTKDVAIPPNIVEAAELLLKLRGRQALDAMTGEDRQAINLNDYMNVRASFPRGKNTGMPWMVRGSNRLVNNEVMAVDAALAAALVRGADVREVFSGMLNTYIVFSRYQRSARLVPLTINGTKYQSQFIEPRRRLINSTVKPVAMAVKPAVKATTELHLSSPEFEQDRATLSDRVKRASVVLASDASRFDFRSGGIKLRQATDVFINVLQHLWPDMPRTIRSLAHYELSLPTLVDVDQGEDVMKISHAPSLKSGASTTSRVGSILNLMYDMFVTARAEGFSDPQQICDYYVDNEPSVIQGDDLLKLFKSSDEAQRYQDAMPTLAEVGMKADVEIPNKFLGYFTSDPCKWIKGGYDHNRDLSESDGLYTSSSSLDNMFYPERFRANAVPSMVARYIMLDSHDAVEFTRRVTETMTSDTALVKEYNAFFDTCFSRLKLHYSTHPNRQARRFFASLPQNKINVSDVDAVRKIRNDFNSSVDDVLYLIAHGSEFDFNPRLFGIGSSNEDVLDEIAVTASLRNLSEGISLDKVAATNAKTARLQHFIRQLFAFSQDEKFIRYWRSNLASVARRVTTPVGDAYFSDI